MSDIELITLDTVAGGALAELFQTEFNRVLENIDDRNTDPRQKREITLKIVLEPHPDRDGADVSVSAKSKLASYRSAADQVRIGYHKGRLVAASTQRQLEFNDEKLPLKAVETEGTENGS